MFNSLIDTPKETVNETYQSHSESSTVDILVQELSAKTFYSTLPKTTLSLDQYGQLCDQLGIEYDTSQINSKHIYGVQNEHVFIDALLGDGEVKISAWNKGYRGLPLTKKIKKKPEVKKEKPYTAHLAWSDRAELLLDTISQRFSYDRKPLDDLVGQVTNLRGESIADEHQELVYAFASALSPILYKTVLEKVGAKVDAMLKDCNKETQGGHVLSYGYTTDEGKKEWSVVQDWNDFHFRTARAKSSFDRMRSKAKEADFDTLQNLQRSLTLIYDAFDFNYTIKRKRRKKDERAKKKKKKRGKKTRFRNHKSGRHGKKVA